MSKIKVGVGVGAGVLLLVVSAWLIVSHMLDWGFSAALSQ